MQDSRHPKFDKTYSNASHSLPAGESLKDVTLRLKPFWDNFLNVVKDYSGNHLIVAHSNSLRAIVMMIEKLSKEEIISINIPI